MIYSCYESSIGLHGGMHKSSSSILYAVPTAETDRQEDDNYQDDDDNDQDEPPFLVLPVHLLAQLDTRPLKLVGLVPQVLSLHYQVVQLLPSVQHLHALVW